MQHVIACLDIDYFYAQAEEVRNPSIKGKPVIVCVYSGRTSESGAVATCNYEARKYGVKSGMPIYVAKRLLRGVDATFLSMDKAYYQELSSKVMTLLSSYANLVEVASIDEAYLDISEEIDRDFDEAERYMRELKQEIKSVVGLTCSIGVGPNKVVAKMAANESKPNGLLVVKPEMVKVFLYPKPVSSLPYVGKKTAEKLASMRVSTIGDLANLDPQLLSEAFGEKVGKYLYLASRGEYDEPLTRSDTREQMSRIITLKRNTSNVDEVTSSLDEAIEWLQRRLIESSLLYRGVGIIAITTDLQLLTRSKTLERPNQSAETIKRTVRQLLERLLSERPGLEMRRVGVKLYSLESSSGQRLLSEY